MEYANQRISMRSGNARYSARPSVGSGSCGRVVSGFFAAMRRQLASPARRERALHRDMAAMPAAAHATLRIEIEAAADALRQGSRATVQELALIKRHGSSRSRWTRPPGLRCFGLIRGPLEAQPGHHRQMTQDQPETSREQLARQAVEAYNELTAHVEELSPQAAQAVRSLRETLTSLVALGTAADLQIADMEKTMEEFEAIFYSGDVTVSARLLRRHLTPEQRAELARLITEP